MFYMSRLSNWIKSRITDFRSMLGRKHNLRAHFWQTLANNAQQGGALILGVCLARLLNPEDFGEIAYIGAIIGMIFLPLEWSAAQVLVADRGKTPGLFAEVMSFGIVVMLAKSAAAILVVSWYIWLGRGFEAVLVVLIALPAIVGTAAGVLRSAVEGEGKFKANFYVQVTSMILAFIVGIGGALAGWGSLSLALMGLTAIFPPLLIFPRFCNQVFSWKFNRQVIQSRGTEGFWLWLNGASESSMARVDRLFLGRVVGEAGLGNYTRAFSYANLSSWVLNSFVTNPAVVSLAKAESLRQRRMILLINSGILVSGAFVSFVILFFYADPVIPFVFGEQWRAAIPVFKAFSLVNFFAAFLYVPITLLLAKKEFAVVAMARFLGLTLFVVFAFGMGSSITPEKIAWLFQLALFLPGLILWKASWRHLFELDGSKA